MAHRPDLPGAGAVPAANRMTGRHIKSDVAASGRGTTTSHEHQEMSNRMPAPGPSSNTSKSYSGAPAPSPLDNYLDNVARQELQETGDILLRSATDPSLYGHWDPTMRLPGITAFIAAARLGQQRTSAAVSTGAPAGLASTAQTHPNPQASTSRAPAPANPASAPRPGQAPPQAPGRG